MATARFKRAANRRKFNNTTKRVSKRFGGNLRKGVAGGDGK